MKQPDPSRRPVPPANTNHHRRIMPVGRFLASGSLLVLLLVGCGRSTPVNASPDTEGDPDIAGVSVTSPDSVVATTPTSAGETTTSSTVAPAPQQVLYTVEPGDTLSVIASKHGVPTDQLAAFNGITDVNSITPGDQLAIPPVAEAPSEPAPADGATETTAAG